MCHVVRCWASSPVVEAVNATLLMREIPLGRRVLISLSSTPSALVFRVSRGFLLCSQYRY